MNHPSPVNQKIELLAYELWQERGRPLGTPETDWYKAEQVLKVAKPEGALSRVAREVGSVIGTAVALVTDSQSGPV